jgi:hypothetical protein
MAATIRQEINIIDTSVTAGSGTTTTDVAIVQLDTTQYSGTVTYYFEVVGCNTTGSGSCTYRLRRKGTTTDDSTVSFSTATNTLTRTRSTAFTPPAGQTEYILAVTAPSLSAAKCVSARIIVTQTDATSITSTETQIEIGNFETQSNASNIALASPKYWKYDSAKWDGTITAYAEVVYKRDSTMSSTSWFLQKSTDLSSWSADTTLVSASTTTTVTRTRVAFTPANGTYYRITSQDGDTMNPSHETYSAKIVVDQTGLIKTYWDFTQINTTSLQGGTGVVSEAGQSLGNSFTTPSSGYSLASISIKMLKIGSPTDNLYVEIASGSISGSTVTTSNNVAGSSVSASASYINFTFTSPPSLSASTTYYWRIFRSGAKDGSNDWQLPFGGSSPGLSRYQEDNQVWGGATTTTNYMFITYATVADNLTLLEPQYLFLNTKSVATGLQSFPTKYDSTEWDAGSGTTTFVHSQDAIGVTANAKLQDIDNANADLTNSSITGANQVIGSSNLTMPTTGHQIDTNIVTVGTEVDASRILARWAWAAVSAGPPVSRNLFIYQAVNRSNTY